MTLSLMNLIVCGFGVWVCICRAAKMNNESGLSIRWQYVLWSTLLLSSGASAPLFGLECGLMQAVLSAGIVINLCAGFFHWRVHGKLIH